MRIYSCVPAFLHVENVGQDLEVAVVEAKEAEAQEEQQLQESEVAEEDQVTTTDSANPDLQQGKHRFINPSILHKFKFMQAPVHLKPSVTTLSLSLTITILFMHLS